MLESCLQAPVWYGATTLTERLALRRLAPQPPVAAEVHAELSRHRLQRWRSQSPFTSDVYFAQRLTMDGLTEEDFLSLLGESTKAVQHHYPAPPAWLVDLADTFARPGSATLQSMLPETLQGKEETGFLEAITTLISRAQEQLHTGIQALLLRHTDPPFTLSTVEALLFAHVPGQLLAMLSRTMVLELHVARLQGRLHGDTPAARFHCFIDHLRQRKTALALLQEYPVLTRQLMQYLERWVCVSLEFLHRLCTNWDAIKMTFSPGHDPGQLAKIDSSVGDTHRGGRSVWIAQFHSGLRVVYKPRSLAVDLHFQQLLAWLNARGDHPPFRVLTMLDCGTYGWVEYVAPQSCHSPEEVQRFYERQGGYLALLYVLEATDFHCENLIAEGEHPVLVDLEALFQPRLDGIGFAHAEELASHTMAYSVWRVGLLPHHAWVDAESAGVDLSGLGAAADQLTPSSVPTWDEAWTDTMHVVRRRRTLSVSRQHRPTLHDEEVDVMEYTEAILTGFSSVYRTLLRCHEALLADTGPLASFDADEVRVILRGTRTYAVLQRESFHPDVLRDALERDRLFDRLWAAVEYRPALARAIPAEREDLQQGDIPLFTTRPASVDLWSSQHARIAGFFDEPGMAQVRRRIQQLGEPDLSQQHWFIRASLATLSPHHGTQSLYPLMASQKVADHATLLQAACAVGDRLETLALRSEQEVSWLGLTLAPDRSWSLGPLGIDLYGGLPGVVLFLAYLGEITHQERYTSLAQAALRALRHQIERKYAFLTSIGAFDGWGGILYVLTHLGALWAQPSLLAEAEAILDQLPALIARDEKLDVIRGAAGCMGGVLSLYRCAPSERTLGVAVQCGDRLIACSQVMEQGIAWHTAGMRQPLAGFSHGAAGMAWALLELYAHTGAERFRTAALHAIAYERSLFVSEVGNWLDLREHEAGKPAGVEGERRYMTSWCHGAPGIGLARLQALPYVDDAVIHAEIVTALQTTRTQGFGRNHSLCHGDLGNLELLLQASAERESVQGCAQVYHLAEQILESIRTHGWRCGTSFGVESPGFMTGLAGIGYAWLRLAEPVRVPSVLMLAPPLHGEC